MLASDFAFSADFGFVCWLLFFFIPAFCLSLFFFDDDDDPCADSPLGPKDILDAVKGCCFTSFCLALQVCCVALNRKGRIS